MIYQTTKLTTKDIEFLSSQIKELENNGLKNSLPELLLGVFVSVAGASFFSLLIVTIIISFEWVSSISIFVDRYDRATGFKITFLVIALFILGTFLFEYIKDAKRNHKQQKAYKSALKSGQKKFASLEVFDAIAFKEPEHGMRILFLKTYGDRVFTLFDYDSVFSSNSKNWLKPKNKLLISFYEGTKTPEVEFLGEELPMKRAYSLKAHAKKWPEPEAFCDTAWEDLTKAYGKQ